MAEPSRPGTLVVIGASAGGQSPLCQLLAGLPDDVDAALLVVVHRSGPNALPRVLSRCGPLPVRFATDGDRLEAGRVLLAPPDHHLEVTDGRVRLGRGPRENGVRPAVDVLFRSAAKACGADVVAVVLSGSLDDGAAGARAVNEAGGMTIVQDPEEATFFGMPDSAARLARPAHVRRAAEIPALVTAFAADPSRSGRATARPAGTEDRSPASDASEAEDGQPAA